VSEEKKVLRLGGLAGILGGLFTILTAVIIFGFLPQSSTDAAGAIRSFPDVKAAFVLANEFSFIAYALWLALFLALYRALRGTSLAFALFGGGLSVLGLAMLFAGAATYIAFAPISDAYHAAGATSAGQATLVLTWQATQGIFNETDTVGGTLTAISFIFFGAAMLRTPSFGKRLGLVIIVLGAAGAIGISLTPLIGQSFVPALLAFPIYVIIPILLGWRVHGLSRSK